jgi:hypothetical protein
LPALFGQRARAVFLRSAFTCRMGFLRSHKHLFASGPESIEPLRNYGRENGQLLGLDRAPEVRTCAPSSKRLAEQEQVFPAAQRVDAGASEEAAILRLACVSGHRRKTEARRPLPKLAMSFVNAIEAFSQHRFGALPARGDFSQSRPGVQERR